MFSGLIIMQLSRLDGYNQQLDRLQAELRAEQQTGADYRYRRAFYGSDAHIEHLARERLGLVRRDEIIFQNIAE
jgi:cell division protein FtsB